MNKTHVLHLLLGMLVSSSVFSATIHQDEEYEKTLDLYGKFETGGYFGRKFNDVGDKWKYGDGYVDDTFMSFGIKGQTGQVYTKLEFDVERQIWTEENEFQYVIDKAYAGWDFGNGHTIEVGRTDTAYDRYDAYGDFSVYGADGAADVEEAGDQDNTVKYEGEFIGFRFGLSYSGEGWDEYETDSREDRVINGYLGYFSDYFSLLVGMEDVHDRGEIYSIHGTAHVGDLSLGGFFSTSDRDEQEAYNTLDSQTYVLSARYALLEKLDLAVSYSSVDVEEETIEVTEDGFRLWTDDEWVSTSAEYAYRPNVKFKTQYTSGGEAGSYAYGKVVYLF